MQVSSVRLLGLLLGVSMLAVGCGGLSKQAQADAYLAAATKFNSGLEELNSKSEATFELFALQDYANGRSELILAFIENLNAVEWTEQYAETANRLIACENKQYVLLREVTHASDVASARVADDTASAHWVECRAIANEFRLSLGLPPVPD